MTARPQSVWVLFRTLLCILAAAGPLLGAPASSHAQPDASPSPPFAEAFQLYTNGFYVEAAEAFGDFRQQHPDHPNAANALYYQAKATLKAGFIEQAARLFKRFEASYPAHPLAGQAQLTLGRYLYEDEQYEASLTYFKRRMQSQPEQEPAAEVLYMMGRAARKLGRMEEARRYFQRLIDTYPTDERTPPALLAVAQTQLQSERYQAAVQTFEHLQSQYPGSASAAEIGLSLAETYYELGAYEEAIQAVQEAAPVDEDLQARAVLIQAESYNQLRDRNKAIEAYRRLIENHPTSPYVQRAAYQLAWNYYEQGRYEEAARFFARVHRDDGSDLARQATYYEATSRRQADQPEAALDLFHQLIATEENDVWAERATYELGATYYEQRRWDEANRFLTRYLNQYPEADRRGEALQLRGRTDVERGSLNNALSSFDEAARLEDAPDSLRQAIQFQRAWLLFQQGRLQDAAASFLDVHEQYPDARAGAEALFWAGESFFDRGQYGQAATYYREYLQSYPSGSKADAARYALAWSYFKQQRYAPAAQWFERFLSQYSPSSDGTIPYRSDALLRLGDSYFALNQYDQARRAYGRVSGAGTEYALYQTGLTNYRQGNYEEALRAFEALRSNFPNSQWSTEAQYRIGYLHLQQQNYDEAIQAYRALLEERPPVELAAQAQYGIGDALFNAGRQEEAIEAYKEVLRRYPRTSFAGEAASSIQYALIVLGEEDRMQRIIEEFAAENPDSPVLDELRFRQAEAIYQSGRTDEALSALQRFVRTSESEALLPEAYYYLGTIYADREQYREAESYLEQLVNNFPDSPRQADAAEQLGDLYMKTGRYDEALAMYQRLEELQPDDLQLIAQARYDQSQALLEMGQIGRARQLLEEVVARAPEQPATVAARLGLARIQEEQGQIEEARQLYQQVAEISQGEAGAEALYRLGALHLEQGNAGLAIETLGRMTTLFPGASQWLARGYLTQARAFDQMGQTGNATRMYDQVINQFSGTRFAETAREEKAALQ